MIIYFIKIFKNSFEAQDAYIDFYKLTIKKDESFSNFYTRFLYFINIRKIFINDF